MDRVRRMFGGGGGTGARIFAGEDPYGGSGASAATLPHRASQLTSLQTKPHRGGGGAGRPSLIDSGKTYSSGVARFGLAKAAVYFSDPFHTLLSLPWCVVGCCCCWRCAPMRPWCSGSGGSRTPNAQRPTTSPP